jgi:hypothetical protein
MRIAGGFLIAAALTLAQPQSFDKYTYEPPSGYTAKAGKGQMEWTKIDQVRKFYCQIVMYESQNSLGSAEADLAAEWKAIVDNSFITKAEILKRDLPLPSAPQSIVRIADTTNKQNKSRVIVSLYVLRYPGRYVGIMQLMPNEQAFEACQGDIAPILPSLALTDAAPPVSNMPGTVSGTWQRVVASQTPSRYNMILKQWEYDPVAAMNQFRNEYKYTLRPDGQYTYEVEFDSFNRYQRDRMWEQGRYTVSGGSIQFEPKEYKKGSSDRRQPTILAPAAPPAPYSRRFILGKHPQYDSVGLNFQESDGSWSNFSVPK